MSEKLVKIELQQQKDYQFLIEYGNAVPSLICDEPPPLGGGTGPSPVQLLACAVGNCLSDSLIFAFRKFKQMAEPIHATVVAEVGRNEAGRMRVLKINATLQLGVEGVQLEHLSSVLDQFESFCTVTQSVGLGVPVHTRVIDLKGLVLKAE